MIPLPSPSGLYSNEHTIYRLEADDAPRYWLHDGLSHECYYLWKVNGTEVLRPYKMRCGLQITEDLVRLNRFTAMLFVLVDVPTTCLWCMIGKMRE